MTNGWTRMTRADRPPNMTSTFATALRGCRHLASIGLLLVATMGLESPLQADEPYNHSCYQAYECFDNEYDVWACEFGDVWCEAEPEDLGYQDPCAEANGIVNDIYGAEHVMYFACNNLVCNEYRTDGVGTFEVWYPASC